MQLIFEPCLGTSDGPRCWFLNLSGFIFLVLSFKFLGEVFPCYSVSGYLFYFFKLLDLLCVHLVHILFKSLDIALKCPLIGCTLHFELLTQLLNLQDHPLLGLVKVLLHVLHDCLRHVIDHLSLHDLVPFRLCFRNVLSRLLLAILGIWVLG